MWDCITLNTMYMMYSECLHYHYLCEVILSIIHNSKNFLIFSAVKLKIRLLSYLWSYVGRSNLFDRRHLLSSVNKC